MAYTSSGQLPIGSEYKLGDYTFNLQIDDTTGGPAMEVTATCHDRSANKWGTKTKQFNSGTQFSSWIVNANETVASVYARILGANSDIGIIYEKDAGPYIATFDLLGIPHPVSVHRGGKITIKVGWDILFDLAYGQAHRVGNNPLTFSINKSEVNEEDWPWKNVGSIAGCGYYEWYGGDAWNANAGFCRIIGEKTITWYLPNDAYWIRHTNQYDYYLTAGDAFLVALARSSSSSIHVKEVINQKVFVKYHPIIPESYSRDRIPDDGYYTFTYKPKVNESSLNVEDIWTYGTGNTCYYNIKPKNYLSMSLSNGSSKSWNISDDINSFSVSPDVEKYDGITSTRSAGAGIALGTDKNMAYLLVYGNVIGSASGNLLDNLIAQFPINYSSAGGGSWIDPGDWNPDPYKSLHVTVNGALSGRHNDPLNDTSFSYVPADKATTKSHGCGGDGGNGGGGGAGASTVIVNRFATGKANYKEINANAKRHGYGSGGGKGGTGGDGCIIVYY